MLYQVVIPHANYDTDLDPTITKTAESPLTFNTNLPSGISLMIYVGDVYSDGTDLKVYTYDEMGEYTDLTTSVQVVNGYVNITTNGQKNYVFGNQTMIGCSFNIMDYVPAIIIGVILALVNFIRMKIQYGNENIELAYVVGITLILTVMIAKLLGGTLPILAKVCHIDPALMASPIITTIVDIVSVMIYFAIATMILNI